MMDALTLEALMRTTRTDGYPEDLLPLANAIEAAEREACAKVAEGGSFLHADSPAARFGRECAAAIRRRPIAAPMGQEPTTGE